MAKKSVNLQEAIAKAIALYSDDEIEESVLKQETTKTNEAPPSPDIIKEDAKCKMINERRPI
jgi:hypothetical protein